MFGRILCANDGSERAFRALTLAVAMAKENGAQLHMMPATPALCPLT